MPTMHRPAPAHSMRSAGFGKWEGWSIARRRWSITRKSCEVAVGSRFSVRCAPHREPGTEDLASVRREPARHLAVLVHELDRRNAQGIDLEQEPGTTLRVG